jgi:hypothetical protein
MLVMRSHWVFHAGVGIVCILHRDVTAAVAGLGCRDRRPRVARVLLLLWYQTTLVLIVFEAGGWLRLRLRRNLRLRLAIVVVSRGHLACAVVSSVSSRAVGVGLPMIHTGNRARREGEFFPGVGSTIRLVVFGPKNWGSWCWWCRGDDCSDPPWRWSTQRSAAKRRMTELAAALSKARRRDDWPVGVGYYQD